MTTATLGAALAVAVALTSCGPTVSVGIAQKRQSKAADDARKYVDQQFAPVQQWMNEQKAGNYTWRPADAYPNETFMQYADRKRDETEERLCWYRGVMDGWDLAEMQRIEHQCKADLELKRIRRQLEQQNRREP
jgi:hypothetical protein